MSWHMCWTDFPSGAPPSEVLSRTSDGGNGGHNADFDKNKCWSNASVFVYMFAGSP